MSRFKITIDESIPLDRAEEALRGLPYELVLTAERARLIQPRSRQTLHSLSVARAIGADEGKYLEAALAVVGSDSRHRRAAHRSPTTPTGAGTNMANAAASRGWWRASTTFRFPAG